MRFGNPAVFVDDVGDAFCVFRFRGFGCTVGQADLAIGVAQQGERKIEFLCEVGVVGGVVETRAEDGGVLLLVLRDEVPEPGTLQRSARGVGLGIEPEYDLPAAKIVKRNRVSVMVRDRKVRSFIANIQHSSSSQRIDHVP